MRYYDVLEALSKKLRELEVSPHSSKQDVIDTVRAHVVQLMKHVITAPMLGEAFAFPGDIDLKAWVEEEA